MVAPVTHTPHHTPPPPPRAHPDPRHATLIWLMSGTPRVSPCGAHFLAVCGAGALPQRTWVQRPAPSWQLTPLCDSSSRRPHTLLWPPWALNTCVRRHACRQHTHVRCTRWRCDTWWVDAAVATGTGPWLLDVESWLVRGWGQPYPTGTPPPGAGGWVAGARARLVVLWVPGVDCMAWLAPAAGRGEAEDGWVLGPPEHKRQSELTGSPNLRPTEQYSARPAPHSHVAADHTIIPGAHTNQMARTVSAPSASGMGVCHHA